MKPKPFACLLLLLLVPPWVDDYVAPVSGTAYDPSTAENNEYLPAAPAKPERSKGSDLRRTARPTGRAARLPARSPAAGAAPWAEPAALHAPPLLYVLMSLQR
jgi:hypothetical protein